VLVPTTIGPSGKGLGPLKNMVSCLIFGSCVCKNRENLLCVPHIIFDRD